jgi:hypothetical protein
MSRMRIVVLAVAVVCVLAMPARADYTAGATAFQAGDYMTALAEWRALAEEGDARAQFGMGVIYEEGGGGVVRDFTQAALWYREAANRGLVDAQFNLGNLYRRGHGVTQDARRAVAWYLKAATQGMAAAQYNLALSYETGSGAAQNYTVAAKWYRMAADQGDVDAQIGLAGLYRFGLGVDKNLDVAQAWFEQAVAQGDARAKFHLEAMAAEQTAEPEPVSAVPESVPEVAAVVEPEPVPEATVEPEPVVAETPVVVVAPVEPAVPTTNSVVFSVQLAAYRHREGAEAAWLVAQAKYPVLLGDLQPTYYRTQLADGTGDVYRLVAGEFGRKADAENLCRRLKQQGADCFVPRP